MTGSSTGRWLKLLLLCVVIAVPTAFAIPYIAAVFEKPISAENADPSVVGGPIRNTPFIVSGVRTPSTLPAHEAGLEDDQEVVGVSASGSHRAYSIRALKHMMSHVVNDFLGSTPVTVTYCDQTDNCQVFTRPGTQAIEVDCAGYFNGLMLRYEGKYFSQRTGSTYAANDKPGESVLEFYPHIRTNWRKWRETYPKSDVYAGDRRNQHWSKGGEK